MAIQATAVAQEAYVPEMVKEQEEHVLRKCCLNGTPKIDERQLCAIQGHA